MTLLELDDGPATGPVWTVPLLRRLLAIATEQPPDELDIDATAAALEVTAGSVRRWIRPQATPEAPAACPQRRLERLLERTRPRPSLLADEAAKARYAAHASEQLEHPRTAPNADMWRRQGWLTDHILAVVEVPAWGLRRTAITRVGDGSRARLAQLGTVVDQTLCPHRFAAEVVRGALLEHVSEWRIVAPHGAVRRGRSETWLAEAPLPDLPYSWPAPAA